MDEERARGDSREVLTENGRSQQVGKASPRPSPKGKGECRGGGDGDGAMDEERDFLYKMA